MSEHPLHLIVGGLVNDAVQSNGNYEVVRDPACVEKNGHNLPLFYKGKKEAASGFTNVDIMVLDKKERTIKIIIEIEESNVNPIHIFGKIFAAASCSHYIYGEKKYKMAEKNLFIQVLESKLPEKSKKPEQWKNIEKSIKEILPVTKNKIKHYKLIFGCSNSFKKGRKKEKELISSIFRII